MRLVSRMGMKMTNMVKKRTVKAGYGMWKLQGGDSTEQLEHFL